MKQLILIIGFGFLFVDIQAQELVSKWSFDHFNDTLVNENITNKNDKLFGFFDSVSGIKGNAIWLDGFTSFIKMSSKILWKYILTFFYET